MSQFHYEKCVKDYEVDYYNDLTQKEKEDLSKKLGISIQHIEHCFFKTHTGWSCRVSGMRFNITRTDWYPIIKKHLDKEFLKFARKEKLKQINGVYCNNNIL